MLRMCRQIDDDVFLICSQGKIMVWLKKPTFSVAALSWPSSFSNKHSAYPTTVTTSTSNFHNSAPRLLLKLCSFKPQKVSQIYTLFSHHDNTVSIPKHKWTSDLNIDQTDINWQTICNNTFSIPLKNSTHSIHKVLHRVYITTHEMRRMGFTDRNTCTYCPTAIDSHLRAFWLCSPVGWFGWDPRPQHPPLPLRNSINCGQENHTS